MRCIGYMQLSLWLADYYPPLTIHTNKASFQMRYTSKVSPKTRTEQGGEIWKVTNGKVFTRFLPASQEFTVQQVFLKYLLNVKQYYKQGEGELCDQCFLSAPREKFNSRAGLGLAPAGPQGRASSPRSAAG